MGSILSLMVATIQADTLGTKFLLEGQVEFSVKSSLQEICYYTLGVYKDVNCFLAEKKCTCYQELDPEPKIPEITNDDIAQNQANFLEKILNVDFIKPRKAYETLFWENEVYFPSSGNNHCYQDAGIPGDLWECKDPSCVYCDNVYHNSVLACHCQMVESFGKGMDF